MFIGTSSSVVYAASPPAADAPVIEAGGTSCTLTKFDPIFQAPWMEGTVAINCSGEFIIETGVYGYLTKDGVAVTPIKLKVCPGSTYCQMDIFASYSRGLWHTWGKGYAKTRDGKKQWYPNTGAYQRSIHCIQA